jgi:drug/metabolite transporter (DMT)-like permease
MKDFLAALLYICVCVASSFVAVEVRKEHIPGWSSIITSTLGMFIWAYVVRNSCLGLVKLSALYDILGALAYFLGFVIYGESISNIQWVGISLMVFSIYLINSH